MIKNKGMNKGLLIFLSIFLVVFISVVIVIPLIITLIWETNNLSQYLVYISTFIQIFIIAGISLFAIKRFDISMTEIKKPDFQLASFFKVVKISLFSFILIRLFSDGLKWIYIGLTENFLVIELPNGMTTPVFLSAIVFLSIIPAFCEELLYRFVGYNLLKSYKTMIILFVLSFSFALSHLASGLESLITSIILGFILTAFYIKNHNYYYVVFIHAFYNILTLFFTYKIYWPTDWAYISTRASSGVECTFWGMIYIAIDIALFALLISVNLITKKRKNLQLLN